MKTAGLIVNPIAGMGGRVGLKGTDGAETLRRARELGAAPEARQKARRALAKLAPIRDELVLLTCAGAMGEDIARELGFQVEVVHEPGQGGAAGPAESGGRPALDSEDRKGSAVSFADGGSAEALDPAGVGAGAGAEGVAATGADPGGVDGTGVDSGADGEGVAATGADPEGIAGAAGGPKGVAATAADRGGIADPGADAEGVAGADASTGADTRAAAKAMAERGVELLLFAGGDGTARDVFAAVGTDQVALGIPAGVKIHSPIYANTPEQAGDLALQFLTGRIDRVGEREVLDIDEEAVRRDELRTALFGYLTVPVSEELMQTPKSPSPAEEGEAQLGIAEEIVENMEPGTCYVVGPGTTTRAVLQLLGLPFTLLGVDAVLDGKLVGQDLAERELLQLAERYPCRLVITPTGGQGYLLGRGNQQISGEFIKRLGKDNVIVVATQQKIQQLRGKPLLVDTGDGEADALLAGYHRITTGYRLEAMHRIAAG